MGLKHRLKRLQQQDVARQPGMDNPEVTIWLPRKDGSEPPPGPMPFRLPHSNVVIYDSSDGLPKASHIARSPP